MTTIISTIVTAAHAALAAAPAIAPTVSRVRLRPLPQGAGTAVVVRPMQAQASAADLPGMPIAWAVQFAVDCYARCPQPGTPDQAVDALLEAAYARLMQDTTLGGAAFALDPQGVGYEFDTDGEQTACATLLFVAQARANHATFT